jgi:hypothetical protein
MRIALSECTNGRNQRAAQAFDLAGITNAVGASFLRVFAKGPP